MSTRIKTFEQKYRSGFQFDESQKADEGVNTRIKTFHGKKNASQFALEHQGAHSEAQAVDRSQSTKIKNIRDFGSSVGTLPGAHQESAERPQTAYASHSQYTAEKSGYQVPTKQAAAYYEMGAPAGRTQEGAGSAQRRASRGVDSEKRGMIFGGTTQEKKMTESLGTRPQGVRNLFASSIVF